MDIAAARQQFFDENPRMHSILSTSQLSVPQIVDALRDSAQVSGEDKIGRYLADINLQGYSFPQCDAAQRLLTRMKRTRTIQRVAVVQWLKIKDVTAPVRVC